MATAMTERGSGKKVKGNSSSKIIPIKLSKTSSARPILDAYMESGKSANTPITLEEAEREDHMMKVPYTPYQGDYDGKAYRIMKIISDSTGVRNDPIGETTHQRLLSMKTDPALKMLSVQSWRDFFQAHGVSKENAHSQKPQDTTAVQPESPEVQAELDENFYTMLTRVELLWDTLKMPAADRKFYRKSLCKGPPQSLHHCKEVATHINMLKMYQANTAIVLASIQTRENAVSKACDILAALYRKVANINGRDFESKAAAKLGAKPAIANRETGLRSENVNSDQWKEELLFALDDVRCTTLEVIKSIQNWRRCLWRPKPFIWRNVNYMTKIKYDMNMLDADIYRNILQLVPMRYEDLLCVVFFNANEGDDVGGISINDANRPENSDDTKEGANAKIVEEFINNIDGRELRAAAAVIMDDEMLQHAIKLEQESLLSKGAFIPTLKLSVTEVFDNEEGTVFPGINGDEGTGSMTRD